MTDIVENDQLPAWLVELRDQQIKEQLEPQPPVAEEPPQEPVRASVEEDRRAQMLQAEAQMAELDAQMPFVEGEEDEIEPASPPDLLEDLREQIILEDDVFLEEQKTSSVQSLIGLQPAQRLLLAVLLFMNVAVCGCMILIMAGRVELPF